MNSICVFYNHLGGRLNWKGRQGGTKGGSDAAQDKPVHGAPRLETSIL